MKNNSFQMGFEIKTAFNSDESKMNTPTQFIPWNKLSEYKEYTPTSTLKYLNDALIGMNYHFLSQFLKTNSEDKKFINNYLHHIDPYFEIYKNSEKRLTEVTKKVKSIDQKKIVHFEKEICLFIDKTFSNDTVQLRFIGEALNCISHFEKEIGSALLYNFAIQFSKNTTEKIISFYSFLFHLRTVIAMNHNSKVEDSSLDCVKCDSISDYLPKTDFTVNDALLYWQFKKLATPFTNNPDVRIEKLFINPLESAFSKYNHNACSLINNLPESYLTFYSTAQLEESLNQVQMDWLLGSSCGLLFRLREEIYGIQHGYDRIFWPETGVHKTIENESLNFCFELLESDFINHKKVG